MNAMAVASTPKILRRGWGKLPLTPIRSSVRAATPSVSSPVTWPAIIATDFQGVITAFSPQAEELLGYRAEDLIGQINPEVFRRATRSHVDFRESAASGFDVLFAQARHDLPGDEEWHFIRQDGVEIRAWVSLTRLRDAHSHTLGYVITAKQAH